MAKSPSRNAKTEEGSVSRFVSLYIAAGMVLVAAWLILQSVGSEMRPTPHGSTVYFLGYMRNHGLANAEFRDNAGQMYSDANGNLYRGSQPPSPEDRDVLHESQKDQG